MQELISSTIVTNTLLIIIVFLMLFKRDCREYFNVLNSRFMEIIKIMNTIERSFTTKEGDSVRLYYDFLKIQNSLVDIERDVGNLRYDIKEIESKDAPEELDKIISLLKDIKRQR
jgi:hypothetical protein